MITDDNKLDLKGQLSNNMNLDYGVSCDFLGMKNVVGQVEPQIL